MKRNRSIILSRVLTAAIAFLLAAVDVLGHPLAKRIAEVSHFLEGQEHAVLFLILSLFSCSVFAWIILAALWRLLGNMRKDIVFSGVNVRHLRIISLCFFAIAVLCAVSAFYFLPSAAAAAVAAFLGLVVRVIRNVFESAITMKDELDFTV